MPRARRDVWNDRAARTRERAGALLLALFVLACQRSEATERAGGVATVFVSVRTPPPARPHALDGVLRDCRQRARIPCDVREEMCQKNVFELMQCLHGIRDAPRPPLRIISADESRRRAEEDRHERRLEQAPLEHAAQQLGLHADIREPSAPGLGANAYYAPEHGVVFFVESEAILQDAELASFILGHEYVHALQDGDGALVRLIRTRNTRTFERELSLWSALEGEATLFEEVLRAFVHDRHPQTWIPERIARRTASSDEAIVRQRRPLEAAFATFPYTYGAHFATGEWLAHGPSALRNHAAFQLSNREFLARRHGWATTEDERCERPEAAPTGAVREALGAFLVQAYVHRRTHDTERARAAAKASRGDWLSIDAVASGTGYGFSWHTCWDSAKTALEMRRLIEEQLRETAGARATVTQHGAEVLARVH